MAKPVVLYDWVISSCMMITLTSSLVSLVMKICCPRFPTLPRIWLTSNSTFLTYHIAVLCRNVYQQYNCKLYCFSTVNFIVFSVPFISVLNQYFWFQCVFSTFYKSTFPVLFITVPFQYCLFQYWISTFYFSSVSVLLKEVLFQYCSWQYLFSTVYTSTFSVLFISCYVFYCYLVSSFSFVTLYINPIKVWYTVLSSSCHVYQPSKASDKKKSFIMLVAFQSLVCDITTDYHNNRLIMFCKQMTYSSRFGRHYIKMGTFSNVG